VNFYKSVIEDKGKLLIRGIASGKPFSTRLQYQPSLFVKQNEDSEYKTLDGHNLKKIKFSTISKARNFLQGYKDQPEFNVFGMNRYNYQFISEIYKGEIQWDKDLISIFTLDIETACENGFPDAVDAIEEILVITVKNHSNKRILTWATGDFVNKNPLVTYIKCDNEHHLLEEFLKFWSKNHPDIVTGWNVKFFDLPYLVNRIRNLKGDNEAKKLSPWNNIQADRVVKQGNARQIWVITGVTTLDYLDLYSKFIPTRQESYKLDYIASVEVGEQKLENPYETFKEFYEKDMQKFIEYNIQDVILVDKLEDKLKLIELCLTMAYEAKVNYQDVFSQVRMWDTIIYNHLNEQKIQIPPREDSIKNEKYEGAYVKDPTIGMHDWIVSFDLNSLYPHLIMQYNISPETFVGMHTDRVTVDRMLTKQLDTSFLKQKDLTMTPNGALFKRDKQGFLPALMEKMYSDRVVFKQKMLEAKRQFQKTKDPIYKKEIARCQNIQWAKKIALNSAYGAIGNEYFRFYDVRHAEGITTGGQLSIRWIENEVNKFMNKLSQTENKNYIVASDTDSIYVKFDKVVSKLVKTDDKEKIINILDKFCEDKVQPYIDSCYDSLADYVNAFAQKMAMKREAIADKALWIAKKRYMMNCYDIEGVRYNPATLKVMGVEAVKSSTPAPCRVKIKEAIKLILTKDESTVISFIEQFKKEFFNMNAREIAFPRSVNNLKEYYDATTIFRKSTPIHVRGALVYNQHLKDKKLINKYPLIQEGDKIKFLMLKMPNKLQNNVISFSASLPKEFGVIEQIDYELQFEKSFIDPLKLILDSIGWSYERKATLEHLFS